MASARRNGRGSEIVGTPRRPLGLTLLVAFFIFGTSMALLTLFMLLFPGSVLDSLWRLNPKALVGLQSLGRWAIALMAIVATACGLSAVGLAKLAPWGRILSLVVLAVNLVGDVGGALVRQDPRTLIGVPIGGAMILYLISTGVRRIFVAGTGEQFGRVP